MIGIGARHVAELVADAAGSLSAFHETGKAGGTASLSLSTNIALCSLVSGNTNSGIVLTGEYASFSGITACLADYLAGTGEWGAERLAITTVLVGAGVLVLICTGILVLVGPGVLVLICTGILILVCAGILICTGVLVRAGVLIGVVVFVVVLTAGGSEDEQEAGQ